VEAYLEALELQRSSTASASAGQATLPFPVYASPQGHFHATARPVTNVREQVLERVVSFLDDPEDVFRVMRASRTLYRLGRMSPVWQHFATNNNAASPAATEKKSWNADWYGQYRRLVADRRRQAQLPRNRHVEGGFESSEHQCKGVELAHRWQTRSRPMLPPALTVGDVNAGIRPPAIVFDSGTLNTKVGTPARSKRTRNTHTHTHTTPRHRAIDGRSMH
jgi:hypothetical protein